MLQKQSQAQHWKDLEKAITSTLAYGWVFCPISDRNSQKKIKCQLGDPSAYFSRSPAHEQLTQGAVETYSGSPGCPPAALTGARHYSHVSVSLCLLWPWYVDADVHRPHLYACRQVRLSWSGQWASKTQNRWDEQTQRVGEVWQHSCKKPLQKSGLNISASSGMGRCLHCSRCKTWRVRTWAVQP